MAVIDRPSIQRIAFGVRYDPQWAVADRRGAIIDQILWATGTPFGPETFPETSRIGDTHILINTDTGDTLKLSERDIILEMHIESDLSQVSELAKGFQQYAIRPLRDTAKAKNINRYGALFRLEECGRHLAESPVAHFLHRDFDQARSLNLRFTRRLGTMEAVAKKRVNDYRNLIYTIAQSEQGEVKISFDYQQYFDPSLDQREWQERPFSLFVDGAVDYFDREFRKWLDRFTRDHAA